MSKPELIFLELCTGDIGDTGYIHFFSDLRGRLGRIAINGLHTGDDVVIPGSVEYFGGDFADGMSQGIGRKPGIGPAEGPVGRRTAISAQRLKL